MTTEGKDVPQDSENATARMAELEQKNTRLLETLKDARNQLMALREEVDRLAVPPSGYGIFKAHNDDGTIDVFTAGREMRVAVAPGIDPTELAYGQKVRLNESLTVVELCGYHDSGSVMPVQHVLDERRVLVTGPTDEAVVVHLAAPLQGERLKPGDNLLVDPKAAFAYELLPKFEADDLQLEEVPDVNYGDIGGLVSQIEQIHDAVELPFLYPDLFQCYSLRPPKGVLLYGPPGCGKTLIAKAVANSLAKRQAELAAKAGGEAGPNAGKAYFINIKGPELLNKFVGETERHIRLIFQRAREKASEGNPVIIFFDEMESLFSTRGSGVSSDMEKTVVPQLLAELDGVEGLENVIVIGASNREDLIDPAILRPGRLDVKIKVERPDEQGARDIFNKYLTDDLPFHADLLHEVWGGNVRATISALIQHTVAMMYAERPENEFLEVTYANGDKETLYFKDFNSGAMIRNIVDRAKKAAIKDEIDGKGPGIKRDHLVAAVVDEFRENEDLPNTTNPDDWARISGKKGERIVYIRTLIHGESVEAGRAIDTATSTGQYL